MDYSSYLPEINIEEGKARVMDNLKLYLRLLGKFDGEKMAADVMDAMKTGDVKLVALATHALRGTAANLSFPVVQKISSEIEALAKADQDSSHLAEPLNEAMTALMVSIRKLLGEQ